VIARKEENPTDSVFVQASGRNIRPSCASSRKTGKASLQDEPAGGFGRKVNHGQHRSVGQK
jgi:hypothetical protein